jgi:AcrR family transcriptional regulator
MRGRGNGTAAGPGRRDRTRAATAAAITQSARRALVEQGADGLSLRAVARDVGLTAPALYRYFPSRDDLLGQLIADLYDEVSDELERNRDAVPANDTSGRLLAVSRGFRAWALAHRREFSLLFGSPIAGLPQPPGSTAGSTGGTAGGPAADDGTARPGWAVGAGPGDGPARQAGQRFGAIFAVLFASVYLAQRFPVPADGDIEPALRAQLRSWLDAFPIPLPLGVMQVFLSCWIRLYSSVCLEVFGHLNFALADAGRMFESELRALAHLLGSPDSYRPPAADAPAALT